MSYSCVRRAIHLSLTQYTTLPARTDFGSAGSRALPSAYWHGVFRTNTDAPYVFVDLEPVPQVSCQEHCLGHSCWHLLA